MTCKYIILLCPSVKMSTLELCPRVDISTSGHIYVSMSHSPSCVICIILCLMSLIVKGRYVSSDSLIVLVRPRR